MRIRSPAWASGVAAQIEEHAAMVEVRRGGSGRQPDSFAGFGQRARQIVAVGQGDRQI